MTVTSLPPRNMPRRRYVGTPPIPFVEPAKPLAAVMGNGRRTDAPRKRRAKRAKLKPLPQKG